jgi:ATP-dependent Clp endopeptidase proteolytic subunit ClpP
MISYFESNYNCDLNKKPIFIRVQKITEDSVRALEQAMSDCYAIKQTILPIVIDSNGGCAYCLLAMFDMIKNSKIKIATIVESKAMSCGAILFSCGHKGYRYIGKNAIIMMHDIRTTHNGKVDDIKADAAEADRLNNLLYEIMSSNCDKEKDFFKKKIHENSHADLYLNSRECFEINIADKIGIPTLKATINVNYRLDIEKEDDDVFKQ